MEREREKDRPMWITRKKLRYDSGASQTVHFVALAGFIKSQVLHFHPPLSEGCFSPAASQLNPPPVPLPGVVVVVIEGAGPNPVKLALNTDSAGLGVPNEGPDEVTEVDEAELKPPNRNGPEGGVGIEIVFPEPESEEDAPGLGASQTVHFSLADDGFVKSQVPHFHPSVLVVGGFNPAAPQLNPLEPELVEVVAVVVVEVLPAPHVRGVEGGFGMENDGVAEDFSAPGFGASHTVHFSVADAGFIKSQVPHFQPSVLVLGGFNPAAPQSNSPEPELVAVKAVVSTVVELVPEKREVAGGLGIENGEGGAGLVAPSLGASHTVHFSVAEVGFTKSQVPHFHPSSCFVGGFKPAAPQLNPPFVVGGVEREVGVGVEVGRVVVLVLMLGPTLFVLEIEERLQASSIEISSSVDPLTSLSALNSPEPLPSLIVLPGSVNVSVGSSEMAIERTSALASLGEIAVVGDTEDMEEAASSLSALMLNRNFEGSLGADDLRLKKALPVAVGEIVGADDEEVPFRPAVCN